MDHKRPATDSPVDRIFGICSGLYFCRHQDGCVTITQTHDDQRPLADWSNAVWCLTINDGGWASIVLTMSAFNERPGDWNKFIAHHQGKTDMLPDPGYSRS